jgi:hypothetical protein
VLGAQDAADNGRFHSFSDGTIEKQGAGTVAGENAVGETGSLISCDDDGRRWYRRSLASVEGHYRRGRAGQQVEGT